MIFNQSVSKFLGLFFNRILLKNAVYFEAGINSRVDIKIHVEQQLTMEANICYNLAVTY